MKLTSPFTVVASNLSRSSVDRCASIAFAAIILVGAAHIADAQTPAVTTSMAPHHTRQELQVSPRPAPTERQHPAGAPVADSQRPSIVIDSPGPDSTVGGPAIIVFRTENIRIMSVFVPEVPDASTVPGGHLHVTVDSAEWHWVHTSVDPVVVTGLAPGKHTVHLELADRNHRPLDARTVTFTIAAAPIR
jgi:Family of unknown function (DUF6130)